MPTTSSRLKQLMNERGLKQVDILKLAEPYCNKYRIKLGKSDVSQFINGKVVPGQWKLSILGMALNVSEAWLMGLDVPMEKRIDEFDSTEDWEDKFRAAVEERLSGTDYADCEAAAVTQGQVYEALDNKKLSFNRACKLADRLGISLDECVLERGAPVARNGDEREKEYLSLFRQLSEEEQILLIRQIKGLVAGK